MRIETERLILRRFSGDDLQDLYEYLSDEEVVRFEPYRPMDRAEAESTLIWRIATEEMIAVVLKSSGKLIGNVYLGKRDFEARELGFVFNRRFWGQGYAQESCQAVMQQVLNLGYIAYMPNATPATRPHGSCWRDWGLAGKPTFGRMCISGKMGRETPYGKIPMYMLWCQRLQGNRGRRR